MPSLRRPHPEHATLGLRPALEGWAQGSLDAQRPFPCLLTFFGVSTGDLDHFRVFLFIGTLAAAETETEEQQHERGGGRCHDRRGAGAPVHQTSVQVRPFRTTNVSAEPDLQSTHWRKIGR